MGRPKDADPEQTRVTILDAAEDEFAEHGFHGTRMMAIAKRAEVTHGLLHYYFESKDGLYEQVVGRLFRSPPSPVRTTGLGGNGDFCARGRPAKLRSVLGAPQSGADHALGDGLGR